MRDRRLCQWRNQASRFKYLRLWADIAIHRRVLRGKCESHLSYLLLFVDIVMRPCGCMHISCRRVSKKWRIIQRFLSLFFPAIKSFSDWSSSRCSHSSRWNCHSSCHLSFHLSSLVRLLSEILVSKGFLPWEGAEFHVDESERQKKWVGATISESFYVCNLVFGLAHNSSGWERVY